MNELESSKIQSLSMIDVVKEAVLFIWDNNKKIVNSIKYPCALTIIISLLINPDSEKMNLIGGVSSIVQLYLYILIVVRLHRIFLLNETEYSLKGAFIWRKNNTSYLLTMIAMGITAAFIATPLGFILFPIMGDSKANALLFMVMICISIGYLLSRFSLVLPSIAIKNKIDFGESWKISKGNGWKVFILIILTPIIFSSINELLYYDSIALRPFYSLLGIIFLLIEVIILSNTYKKLMATSKNCSFAR